MIGPGVVNAAGMPSKPIAKNTTMIHLATTAPRRAAKYHRVSDMAKDIASVAGRNQLGKIDELGSIAICACIVDQLITMPIAPSASEPR